MAVFGAARGLYVFGAQELTSAGLESLLRAMPALESLRLVNNANPAMDVLAVRSGSLERVVLTHFHALRRVEFDAPALRKLELDNCDDGAIEAYNDRAGVGDGIVYGPLIERFLSALLDGSPALRLPALRDLSLWNNPYSVGPLLAIEALRTSVSCLAGHPALERLQVYNAAHLRSLTLRSLPKLARVTVSQYDDEGPGTTWLESVDLRGLPEGCDVSVGALTEGRVGL